MSTDLEDYLRDALSQQANQAPAPSDLARKATRRVHRRRLALGSGTAIVALVVAGGSALALSRPSAHSPARISAQPVLHGALPGGDSSCVELYSPQTLQDRAFAFDGVVTSIGTTPVTSDGLEGTYVAVTFTVSEWFHGGSGQSATIDMTPPVPTSAGTDENMSYDVGARLLVSGEPRSASGVPAGDVAWSCGFTRYYDDATARAWRAAYGG